MTMVAASEVNGRVTPVKDTALNTPTEIVQHGLYLFFTNQFHNAQTFYAQHGSNNVKLSLLNCFLLTIKCVSTHSADDMNNALDYIWSINAIGASMAGSWSNTHIDKQIGQLLQADCHLLGGFIQLIQESYVKAIWNIRKAYKLIVAVHAALVDYQITESDDSTDYNDVLAWSNFEVGYVNLLLSLMPPTLLKVVSYFGFSDVSRQKGLDALHTSYKSDGFVSDFASLMLINYNVNIKSFLGTQTDADIEFAQTLIDVGQAKYDNRAVIYTVLYSRLLRCQRKLQDAVDVATKSLNYCIELPALLVLFYYQISWCTFFMLDWSVARHYFDKLLTPTYIDTEHNTIVETDTIDTNNLPAHIKPVEPPKAAASAFYAYHAGLCCALNKQYDAMYTYMISVPTYLDKKSRTKPIEAYAKKRAETLVALYKQVEQNTAEFDTLTVLLYACELIYIWHGTTQMPDNKIQELYDILQAEKNKYVNNMTELQSYQVQLYTGIMLRALKQTDTAHDILHQLDTELNQQQSTLKHYDDYELLYTLCSYELASMQHTDDRNSDVNQYMKQVNKYDKYMLYNMIQIKIHALKKQ